MCSLPAFMDVPTATVLTFWFIGNCATEKTHLNYWFKKKKFCWGLRGECDLVKCIWIGKRCAWNATAYCNSVQSSTSFCSPPVTKVIEGFIMLELLTQMWKYCKTLSAFTVENVIKCIFPTGFKGSICQCTYRGVGCAVMFGKSIIGQWYSHQHSSDIWNIE